MPKPSTKKGFTLVEITVGMVVLSFAALVLASFARATWALQLEADAERDNDNQLRQSLYLPSGTDQERTPASVQFTVKNTISNVLGPSYTPLVQAVFNNSRLLFASSPQFLGASLWQQSSDAVPPSSDVLYHDSLSLPAPNLAGLTLTPFQNLAPDSVYLAAGRLQSTAILEINLISPVIVLEGGTYELNSNSVILAGSASQATLVYVQGDSTIDGISLPAGWYQASIHQSLGDFASNATSLRLDAGRFAGSAPTLSQKQQLSQLLNIAYARIQLAGFF